MESEHSGAWRQPFPGAENGSKPADCGLSRRVVEQPKSAMHAESLPSARRDFDLNNFFLQRIHPKTVFNVKNARVFYLILAFVTYMY